MNQVSQYVIVGVIFLGVFLLLGILLSPKKETITPGSTFSFTPSISPTPQKDIPTPTEEFITTWRKYTNDTYQFSIDVPVGWNEQEYIPSDQKKGMTVAFSPNPLPCGTCTYFYNGYYSVKIYNHSTDLEAYADFLKRKGLVGKENGYQSVQLADSTGVYAGNKIAIEHDGWVYEISFDKDGGKAKIADSKIFQKAAPSFQFTSLLFNK